jgi:hypothetical protein
MLLVITTKKCTDGSIMYRFLPPDKNKHAILLSQWHLVLIGFMLILIVAAEKTPRYIPVIQR